MLHARVAAVRTDGTLIGHSLREINACILEPVDSRKDLRPDDAPQRLVTRVGTAVIDVPRSDRGDDAIFIQRNSRITECTLVAVSAGRHVLGAGLDPFNRASSGLLGRQGAHRHLRIAGNLDSEAAANIERLNANAVNVDVEVRG